MNDINVGDMYVTIQDAMIAGARLLNPGTVVFIIRTYSVGDWNIVEFIELTDAVGQVTINSKYDSSPCWFNEFFRRIP